jgi:hypothetical protein
MKNTYILKQFTALLAIAIFFSSPIVAQESKPLLVTIPEGTQISARLVNQLDSGQVHVGDAVTLDVLEDLNIQNETVIPHGSIVMGHVVAAKGARKMGRGGQLEISFETVTAGDGTKVPVSGERFAKGEGGYGGGSMVGAAAAGLFFPPAGALLLLKHGHASVIPAGAILTVHVTANTSVAGFAVVAPVQQPVPAARPAQAMMVISSTADQSSQTLGDKTANPSAQPESLGEYARRMKAEKSAQPPQ